MPQEIPVTVLEDRHGLIWFFSHCTRAVRLKLLGLIVGLSATIFGVRFRIGMMDTARNLYMQYTNFAKPTVFLGAIVLAMKKSINSYFGALCTGDDAGFVRKHTPDDNIELGLARNASV
jgi:hypothetical protein